MYESEWLSRDRRLVSVHCVTNEFIVTNYCVHCCHFISDWREGRCVCVCERERERERERGGGGGERKRRLMYVLVHDNKAVYQQALLLMNPPVIFPASMAFSCV